MDKQQAASLDQHKLIIETRIQERKDIIYVIAQDLEDNEEEYSDDYKKALRDEIANHENFIADYRSSETTLSTTTISQPAGLVWVKCPDCGGDGKETCHNPDHGFISAMPGETSRLGCPLCGHNDKHKINGGKNKCYTCNGTGKLPEKDALKWAEENNYEDELIEISAQPQQLFTREQVREAFLKGGLCALKEDGFMTADEFMDTNYPTTIK